MKERMMWKVEGGQEEKDEGAVA
jgi:hypothetical protein